jgi:hypothetical protein
MAILFLIVEEIGRVKGFAPRDGRVVGERW